MHRYHHCFMPPAAKGQKPFHTPLYRPNDDGHPLD